MNETPATRTFTVPKRWWHKATSDRQMMLWYRCPTEVTTQKLGATVARRRTPSPSNVGPWRSVVARMSSQPEKILKSFARGDMATALADTGHTGRKQIMDMSVWNSVKDAKAPACCALAAPECNVTSERFVSTSAGCTEYRNRTEK